MFQLSGEVWVLWISWYYWDKVVLTFHWIKIEHFHALVTLNKKLNYSLSHVCFFHQVKHVFLSTRKTTEVHWPIIRKHSEPTQAVQVSGSNSSIRCQFNISGWSTMEGTAVWTELYSISSSPGTRLFKINMCYIQFSCFLVCIWV